MVTINGDNVTVEFDQDELVAFVYEALKKHFPAGDFSPHIKYTTNSGRIKWPMQIEFKPV